MISALWPPLVTGWLLTLGVEALLRPAPCVVWRRPWATQWVHLASWLLLFALFVLVLQRPWFALVFIVSLQLVVVQTSNTKSATLNEPFICQDFAYFLDAILHPRLYVPFFGIGLAIAASSAGTLAIAAFLWFEPSLVTQHGAGAFLAAGAGLVAASLLLLLPALRQLPACSLAPHDDLKRLGLAAALWAYGRLALRPLDVSGLVAPFTAPDDAASFEAPGDAPPFTAPPFTAPDHAPSFTASIAAPIDPARLPHVVVVQSESFFDPRGWLPATPPGLLDAWDRLTQEAVSRGPLVVPAWGANTVRTEASFLTGLPADAFGIHRFNPYPQLARRPLPTLASRLKALGYRTVCVHPYPASFYGRDRVMPKMGFDEFLDIRAFPGGEHDGQSDRDGQYGRDGQYMSDAAIAEKVGTLLDHSDNRPLFVFAITMENHGPLHLERPVPEDAPRLAASAPAVGHEDLRVYLRHLRNADRMLERLERQLTPATPGARHGMLCWYGDHVPIMDDLYRKIGAPSGDTCHAIWSSRRPSPTPPGGEPLEVAALGQRLVDQILIDAESAPCDKRDPFRQPRSPQEQE